MLSRVFTSPKACSTSTSEIIDVKASSPRRSREAASRLFHPRMSRSRYGSRRATIDCSRRLPAAHAAIRSASPSRAASHPPAKRRVLEGNASARSMEAESVHRPFPDRPRARDRGPRGVQERDLGRARAPLATFVARFRRRYSRRRWARPGRRRSTLRPARTSPARAENRPCTARETRPRRPGDARALQVRLERAPARRRRRGTRRTPIERTHTAIDRRGDGAETRRDRGRVRHPRTRLGLGRASPDSDDGKLLTPSSLSRSLDRSLLRANSASKASAHASEAARVRRSVSKGAKTR